MNVRTAATAVASLLLAGALAGCTQTIDGTPGPRPTVSASGDFPSGGSTDAPTDSPTDGSSETPTDEPTDEPTDPTPTEDPTDVPTDGDSGSVETLCSRLDYATEQGADVDPEVVKSYVSTVILVWGIANGDDDPYAKADSATTTSCPDTRTAVLKLMDLPDLESTKS
jgi:hypothetical protein